MDPELAAAVPYLPDVPFSRLAEARAAYDELVAQLPSPDLTGVTLQERSIPGPEGAPDVPVRVLRPEGGGVGLPAVLDIHGGGFAIGTAAIDDGINASIVREVGAVVVSVDYRLAPEHPYPAAADDCYAALVWLAAAAAELGIDSSRIAVLGDSAGGGLAAATALLARDRGGPALTMQVLIEPELDDRLETHSMVSYTDTPIWRHEHAVTSWEYYLAGNPATGYAAPARMEDLRGLPPTYLTVNEFDPLRDEGLQYAQRLLIAGVSTEVHCYAGAFHGFVLVPTAAITLRALANLYDALRRGLHLRHSAGPALTGDAAATLATATGV